MVFEKIKKTKKSKREISKQKYFQGYLPFKNAFLF
jgi:hypothetical protein